MFSKPSKDVSRLPPNKPASAPSSPDPSARKGPVVPSVIARDMVIDGGLVGDGELHVDGVVRGDIRVSRLTIGESGQIEGTISAETVDARGRVLGTITAQQVRLSATAHVEGDITHEQLAIETGASFQGRSLKLQPPIPESRGEVIALAPPSAAAEI